jgi:hypothetical protein
MKPLAWKSRLPILRVQHSFCEWLAEGKTPDGLIQPDVKVHAANTIATAKALNAQAILVWDVEPAIYEKYMGCPEAASAYALQFNKLIRAAGYPTGCNVRWENFDSKGIPDMNTQNGFENACRRLWYARHTLQCRYIYFDSSQYQDNSGRGLKTEHFQQMHAMCPDVLLCPEHGDAKIHQFAARYRELRGGFTSTPADVLAQVPGAWSVIFVDEGGIRQHFDELVAAVKAGNVLMTNGWYMSDEQRAVAEIYRAAGMN